ncbi:YesL family protein [Piscibacillus halophilus]|uniref:Uncharacterized membrane protein YesL n=1 Tax=Piscibacillus halophilus TaxID=571933 RepID=A0A1H9HUQ2_9BACI|nr:DUF624 domain-containing protein [Piscibacillus halophilus]SEQ66064.1 Uncharacterized membrane protein YesL [Piscibacillus halophilus]
MKQFMQSLYLLTNWIMNLVYINLLWFVFTLLGGIILGIVPATVTLYTIIQKWIQGHHEFKLHEEFWKLYKQTFLESNKLYILIGPLMVIISINLLFIVKQGTFQIVHIPFWMIILILGLTLLYIIPTYNYFELPLLGVMKNALLIMLVSPVQNLFLLLSLGSLLIIYYFIPGIAFFFNVSAFAWLNTFFVMDATKQALAKKQ